MGWRAPKTTLPLIERGAFLKGRWPASRPARRGLAPSGPSGYQSDVTFSRLLLSGMYLKIQDVKNLLSIFY